MFKRIIYEEWTTIVPIAAFLLTFGVFMGASIRALLLKKNEREKLANMPLETEAATEAGHE